MPLYEYKCVKCGHRFEKIESLSAPEMQKCPKCKGKAPRQITASAIQFKGTGWYVTDYARKGSAPSSSVAESSGDSAPAKSEQKPGESSKPSESPKPSAEKGTAKKKK